MRVLLERLVTHLAKKFPASYGTRSIISVCTRARHWSLSLVRSIQSTDSHPTSLRYILILSSCLRLGLPKWSLPFKFSNRNNRCISPLYHAYYMFHPYHPPLFDSLIIFCVCTIDLPQILKVNAKCILFSFTTQVQLL
jgi:hypothetical protein